MIKNNKKKKVIVKTGIDVYLKRKLQVKFLSSRIAD